MSPLVLALLGLVALVILLAGVLAIVRGPAALGELLTPGVRRWLYGLAAAALGLLSAYGVLHGNVADSWGFLLAALFGVAHGNTPTAGKAQESPADESLGGGVTDPLEPAPAMAHAADPFNV